MCSSDLETIARLPKLEQLLLGGTVVSNGGLAQLTRCSSLRYLDLEGNSISDETLILLSQLISLEGLNIACRGDDISDRGIEALARLVNLRLLGFVRPPSVSEEKFESLRRMPSLKTFVPGGCAFLYHTSDPFYEAIEPLS